MASVQVFEPAIPAHFDALRSLFKEYIDYVNTIPGMLQNMDIQQSDKELAELETGKFAAPDGALLLATMDEEYVGAVALKKLSDGICEMKRLYVRPQARGSAVGRLLGEKIIEKGAALGYKKMRLDTHSSMTSAQRLYRRLGFYDIPQYNENPVAGVLFMELAL